MTALIDNIVIQSLRDASSRIRRLFIANLTLCAVIFAVLYTNSWAHELVMFEQAYLARHGFETEIVSIKNKYPQKEYSEYEKEDKLKISGLQLSIARIDNSMKDIKLPMIEVPLIGFKAHPNSMIVVCGILMLFLSFWLVFTSFQIADIFSDPISRKTLDNCKGAHRHIFATIYSIRYPFLSLLLDIVIYLPCMTVILVLFMLERKVGEAIEKGADPTLVGSMETQFVVYWWIALALAITGIVICIQWESLTSKLLRHPEDEHEKIKNR